LNEEAFFREDMETVLKFEMRSLAKTSTGHR
jgi:hypothetical protein